MKKKRCVERVYITYSIMSVRNMYVITLKAKVTDAARCIAKDAKKDGKVRMSEELIEAKINTSEARIDRIKAIISVADDTVERAKTHGDRYSVDMAKSVAYDHIKRIMDEVEE